MSVRKINGFRAPYRSLTFRDEVKGLVGRNGILSMTGEVSQVGLNITVPPFLFSQKGLLVEVDTATVVASPSMSAPYYLTVSALSVSNVDDLRWQFAKSPLDLSEEEVIVASYDGLEWRSPQFLTLDGIYQDIDSANVDFDNIGPFSGLITSVDGANYKNTAGKLVDRQGLRTRLDVDALFPAIAADPDYSRVDKVLYRRPNDSKNRIGLRKLIVGGTFAATPDALYNTQHVDTSFVSQNTKVLVASDNKAMMLTSVGYGSSYSLLMSVVSSDRQTILTANTVLASDLTDPAFDVVLDESGNIHLAYTSGLQIKWKKFSSAGALIAGPIRLDTQTSQCKNPVLAIDPAQTSVFVSYQCQTAPTVSQIYFRTITLGGTLGVSPKSLAGALSFMVDPSIFVTDDLWVYVSWTDQTAGHVYYRTFDDIGDPLDSSATLVSGNTQKVGGGTLSGGAKKSKIRISDNKKTIVGFLQDKGGSLYGLSFWSDSQAYMATLISGSDNITSWDFVVDPIFNAMQVLVGQSTRADYVKLESQAVVYALHLSVSGVNSVSLLQDKLGSIVHSWTSALTGTFATYDSGIDVAHVGLGSITGPMGTTLIAANQAVVTVSDLSQVPVIGDRVTISGAVSGNNGSYYLSAVQLIDVGSVGDRYLLTMTTSFVAAEDNVTAAFAEPVGNEARFAKSVADTKANAYRYSTLDTDVLLARIVMPGPVILNYVTHTGSSEIRKPYLVGGTNVIIDWSKTAAGSLTLDNGLKLLNLLDNIVYDVADGSYPMAEGDAAYVVLDGINTSVTPQVTPRAMLPWGNPIQVLGVVEDGIFNPLLLSEDVTQLEAGEEGVLGHDLPTPLRARLGITSETTFEAYTSTYVINSTDTYPTAISKLDDRIEALETNHPDEEEFIGDGTTKIFTLTRFALNLSNSVFDNEVWVAGRKQRQDPTGGLNRSYRKISTTQIEFVEAPHNDDTIIVRKEGTNYGGPIPPIAGQLWSDAVDHDILGPDLAYKAGDASHRFSEGHFQNTYSERIEMPLPVGGVATIKVMESGHLNPIGAGKPVSKGSDGKIYPGKSDGANGQSFIGITAEPFAAFGSGRVILAGPNIPGALTGLGFAPGEDIYLSETEGGYTNDPGAYVGLDDSIIRVGVADCSEGVASALATDLVMMTYVVARP